MTGAAPPSQPRDVPAPLITLTDRLQASLDWSAKHEARLASLTLTEWLLERLAEVEQSAQLMAEHYPPPWEVADRGWMARVVSAEPNYREILRIEQEGTPDDNRWPGDFVKHIASHDPARVLARIAAERRIVQLHDIPCDECLSGEFVTIDGVDVPKHHGSAPCATLRILALPYAGHDGYRSDWAP